MNTRNQQPFALSVIEEFDCLYDASFAPGQGDDTIYGGYIAGGMAIKICRKYDKPQYIARHKEG
jgi:hypothetical protein